MTDDLSGCEMPKRKVLWDDEWVKVMPLNDAWMDGIDKRCELCNGLSCAAGWLSIKTNRFRCRKCFMPTTLRAADPPRNF